jgi:hypothetical protein
MADLADKVRCWGEADLTVARSDFRVGPEAELSQQTRDVRYAARQTSRNINLR